MAARTPGGASGRAGRAIHGPLRPGEPWPETAPTRPGPVLVTTPGCGDAYVAHVEEAGPSPRPSPDLSEGRQGRNGPMPPPLETFPNQFPDASTRSRYLSRVHRGLPQDRAARLRDDRHHVRPGRVCIELKSLKPTSSRIATEGSLRAFGQHDPRRLVAACQPRRMRVSASSRLAGGSRRGSPGVRARASPRAPSEATGTLTRRRSSRTLSGGGLTMPPGIFTLTTDFGTARTWPP